MKQIHELSRLEGVTYRALIGVLLGLLISYGLGPALQGLLFGVTPTDMVTLAGATLVLLATVWIAAWLPAWRTSRMDAAASLRSA